MSEAWREFRWVIGIVLLEWSIKVFPPHDPDRARIATALHPVLRDIYERVL